MKKTTSLLLIILFTSTVGHAQMKRERANVDRKVQNTFWAPHIVGLPTVEQLDVKNLNVTIMHSFGNVSNRPLHNFFGLDFSPNVRLGLDYGITSNWSLGVGRTTLEKVIDVRSKLALFRQTDSNSTPLSLSLKGDIALTTQENNRSFADDLSFLISSIAARKFNDDLSLQVVPMYAHFNTVNEPGAQQNDHFAVGIGAEYHISDRYALSAEYYPTISARNEGTNNALALALNIETGGHVFQLFFSSFNWHTEQYILARNNDRLWSGDFRFGFNVNRLFFLGKN